MPDIPPDAVAAALAARWRTDTGTGAEQVQAILEAAAPHLAEAVAAKILRHMNEHGPQAGTPLGGTLRRAWRRHFYTAARVASFAFSTDEDIRRETAAALNRGDYIACRLPEDGEPATGKRGEKL